MKGLYIHIPFCKSKCKYCDFYSFKPDNNDMDSYLSAVLSALQKKGKQISGKFDTVYFGGGTPSFFGAKRIESVLSAARAYFDIAENCEITVECNPSSVSDELMRGLSKCGVNRISMGVQSAITHERKLLGRESSSEKAAEAVRLAKENGITNLSLDLMLGIPDQTLSSLEQSLDFILESGVKHISAYMLKIEEGTPLEKEKAALSFPDEDSVCDMYLHTAKRLSQAGFSQYEISNFALPGFESRHNLKYWTLEDYLGIGPSAHSYLDGKRYYYPRDIKSFTDGCEPVPDGAGGGKDEYIMLRLRLASGIDISEYEKLYGEAFPKTAMEKCRQLQQLGLMKINENAVSLTPKGFLVSNSIIGKILNDIA